MWFTNACLYMKLEVCNKGNTPSIDEIPTAGIYHTPEWIIRAFSEYYLICRTGEVVISIAWKSRNIALWLSFITKDLAP